MITSSSNHRQTTFIVAATTGLVGALLATTLTSAQAKPGRDHLLPVPTRTAHVDGHHHERGCFITPPTWNQALDGPLPRCYTYLP